MDAEVLDDISGPAGTATIVASSRGGIDPAIDGLSDPLREALMNLNEGFRFAVVLCDLLGFPYSEAAEILGVQEGTIKSRIFRAREALATALREAGYEIPGGPEPATGGGRHTSGRERGCGMSHWGDNQQGPDFGTSTAPLGHLDEWDELVVDYLDGTADPTQTRTIETHLAACTTCAARMGSTSARLPPYSARFP